MTERREVVVGSVLQAHQLQQYLRSAGINDFELVGMTTSRVTAGDAVFIIAAESEQWTGINQWLQRIGAQS